MNYCMLTISFTLWAICCVPLSGQVTYMLGNSLTMDTRPTSIDGTVDFHVQGSKNLPYFIESPDDVTDLSVPWPQALRDTAYDTITAQPHTGSNIDSDADSIAVWVDLQPRARLIIHTGWGRHEDFVEDYESDAEDGEMVHSPAYYDALEAELKSRYPNLWISRTKALAVLNAIRLDVEQGVAPYATFDELYRDHIHMSLTDGRYLMHNVMRRAIGQPYSDVGFGTVDEENRGYLLSKIDELYIQLTEPTPGISGLENTVTVTMATPNAHIALIAGREAGASPIPGCPNLQVGIAEPVLLGVTTASPDGTATFAFDVPADLAGTLGLMQVVDGGNCSVSNLVQHTFE